MREGHRSHERVHRGRALRFRHGLCRCGRHVRRGHAFRACHRCGRHVRRGHAFRACHRCGRHVRRGHAFRVCHRCGRHDCVLQRERSP